MLPRLLGSCPVRHPPCDPLGTTNFGASPMTKRLLAGASLVFAVLGLACRPETLPGPSASVLSGSSPTAWYASPTGPSSGTGSILSPWDLTTALAGGNGTNRVQAGDTIYLRGGIYRGTFVTTVSGPAGSPVIVRQ